MVEGGDVESIHRHPSSLYLAFVLAESKVDLSFVGVQAGDAWDKFVIAFVILPNAFL